MSSPWAAESSTSHQSIRPRVSVSPAPYIPALAPVKGSRAINQGVNPANPVQTNLQEDMLYWFEKEGYWGLALTIYAYANTMDRDRSDTNYWNILVRDWASGDCYLYYLLLSLPGYIIRALVKNTLTSEIVLNGDVGKYAATYMSAKLTYPGVYLNIPAKHIASIMGPTIDAGEWLSSAETEAMLRDLRSYIGAKTPAANQFAKAFDKHLYCNFAGVKELIEGLTTRRYASNSKQVQNLSEWANTIENQYVKGLSQAERDKPFKRCPTEVGWSMNINERVAHHAKNIKTTYIFGFLHAWTRFSLPQLTKFPPAHHYTIFRLWEGDEKIGRVEELAAMILTSSYKDMGGLNVVAAGNVNRTKNWEPAGSSVWKNSAENMFAREHVQNAIETDFASAKGRRDAIFKLNDITPLEANITTINQQIEDLKSSIAELKEKKKGLEEEYEKVEEEQFGQATQTDNATNLLTEQFSEATIDSLHVLKSRRHGRAAAADEEINGNLKGNLNLDDPLSKAHYQTTLAIINGNTEMAIKLWKAAQEETGQEPQPMDHLAWRKFVDGFEAQGA
ncbi:hypothetical protein MMC17_007064 [Xylographa soralifera]|nr:hypothetical protein [Xylographa soralifera]